MTTTISKVLHQLHQHITKPVNSKLPLKLGLVSGNQSGDADSIISSITYCYLHHQHQLKKSNNNDTNDCSSKTVFLPYLNFPRSELRLRKDVQHIFAEHQITSDVLLFSDDLDHVIKPNGNVKEVILVDHNVPQGALAQFLSTGGERFTVVGIVDHHVDEGKFLQVQPRIVRSSGSCVSLIYSYFKTLDKEMVSKDTQLLKFMVNAVILDTSNMSSRVEEAEEEVYMDFCSNAIVVGSQRVHASTIQMGESTKEIHAQLIQAKNDISGLTFMDLLNKDYKNFAAISPASYQFGISSIGVPLEYIISTYSKEEEVLKDVTRFIRDNKIEFLAVMTSFVRPGSKDEFHRQLAFFGVSDSFPDSVISQIQEQLSLIPFKFNPQYLQNTADSPDDIWSADDVLLWYEQANIKCSRKQIAPLLRDKVGQLEN